MSVPAANAAAPFDESRSLVMPAGWHAEVWARVSGARYALWTPAGTLLVTATGAGELLELVPRSNPASPPSVRVLASGLTNPQGLAFDTLGKQRMLYVAESDRIDRYVWRGRGSLGARTVVVRGLPDDSASGDDVHRLKGIAVGPDHSIYVTVGSAWNANGADTTTSPPRGAVYAFDSNGAHRRVFAAGVRNGEGLAFAPDGTLWTAVNERDNVPYPFHRSYDGVSDAYGHVMQSYVNENPPDEVARLTAGRNLGWPYCNPSADVVPGNPEAGQDYDRPRFVRDVQTNPDGKSLDCSKLAAIDRPIPAHSAPVSLTFLEGSTLPARWRSGRGRARFVGPQPAARTGGALAAVEHHPANALQRDPTGVGIPARRRPALGAAGGRRARPRRRALRHRRHCRRRIPDHHPLSGLTQRSQNAYCIAPR